MNPYQRIILDVPDFTLATRLAAALAVKGWSVTYNTDRKQITIRSGRMALHYGTRDYAIGWIDAYMSDGP